MFEKLISSILEQYLEQYIENFDSNQLNIGLFSGDVVLRDLNLKSYAFDHIHPNIPIVISVGYLETLKLKIPSIANLKKSPVVCEVYNAFLVLMPKKAMKWDEEYERKKNKEIKTQKLKQFEMKRKIENEKKKKQKPEKQSNNPTTSSSPPKQKENEGFFDKLLETILNNIQIKISNVHIRYEDAVSIPGKPIVLGATLENIFVQSTDENFQTSFIKEVKELAFKLVQLNRFSIYMNFSKNPQKDFISLLQSQQTVSMNLLYNLLGEMIRDHQHEYILQPVMGHVKLTMQKLGRFMDFSKPQFDAQLFLDTLAFQFTNEQYKHLISMVEYFSNYLELENFRKFRPHVSVSQDKKGWWRFAIRSTILRQQSKRISWNELSKRRKERKEYIYLYKKVLHVPWESPITDLEKKRFYEIEDSRPADDLILFRKFALAEIDRELHLYETSKKTASASQPKKSWFSFKIDDKKATPITFAKLTEEEKVELYKSIGYEDNNELKTLELRPEFVKIKFHFQLQQGSVTLLQQQTTMAQIVFQNVLADIQLMNQSFKTLVSIGGFEVLDRSIETKFPKIISRRKSQEASKSSLISIFFEKNPPGSKSDFYIAASIDRLDMVMNYKMIQSILGFLSFDDVNFQKIETLAKKQVQMMKVLAKKEIVKALENQKTFDFHLNCQAPNIIIPVDCSKSSTKYLLIDLGKMQFVSDIDSKRLERVKKDEAKKEDFYDKFEFIISDLQIVAPEIPFTEWEISKSSHTHSNIIEKTSFNVNIVKSVIPEDVSMERISLSSQIPTIQVNISPEKLELFTHLLNETLQFVDNPTGYSAMDVKFSNRLKVKAPFTKEWKLCWVEVRSTRKMLIFEEPDHKNLIATIKLNKHVEIVPHKSNTMAFVVKLMQRDTSFVNFQFLCEDEPQCSKTINSLQTLIYSFDTSFFVGNIANMVVADLKQEFRNQEQGKGFINSPLEQVLLLGQFQCKEFLVNLQQKESGNSFLQICLLQIESKLRQRLFDTSAHVKMSSLSMIETKTGKQILLSTTNNSEELGELTIERAAELSPNYSNKAMVTCVSKFHNVDLYLEPELLSVCIDFGYDTRDGLDQLQKRQHIYSAHAPIVASDKQHAKGDLSPDKKQQLDFLGVSSYKNLLVASTKIGIITVVLSDPEQKFASIAMNGASCSCKINLKRITLKGNLGSFSVTDFSIPNTIYQEIIGLKKEDEANLMEFKFVQLFKTKQDIANRTIQFYKYFDCKTTSIKYVHIQKFYSNLQRYISKPLRDAMNREKLRFLKSNQTKMFDEWTNKLQLTLVKLNIEILSPTILFPANQHSKDFFNADLGKITIKSELQETDQSIQCAYKIDWCDMKVTSYHSQIQRTCSIVNDVSISFLINQLLRQHQSHQQLPQRSVDINVSDINFELSHVQYQLVFDFVNYNIIAGLQDALEDVEFYKSIASFSTETSTKLISSFASSFRSKEGSIEEEVESSPVIQSSDDIDTYITSIVRINFPLCKAKLLKGNGEEGNGIVTLEMNSLSILNTYSSDSAIHLEVKILSIVVKDERQDANSCFKIVYDSNPQNTHQIECFQFIFNQKEGRYFYLTLSDPTVYIIPELLLDLKDFVAETNYSQSKQLLLQLRQTSFVSEDEMKQLLQALQHTMEKEDRHSQKWVCVLKFGKPCVVLPEDSTKQDSKCLVVETALDIYFEKQKTGEELGKFSMNEFTSYVTYFWNSKGSTNRKGAAIIEPITVHGNLTRNATIPEEDVTRRFLTMELIEGGHIRISYSDISFIYRVLQRLQIQLIRNGELHVMSQQQVDATKQVVQEVMQLESDIVQVASTVNQKAWHLDVKVESKKKLAVLLVDDFAGNDVPLISFIASNVMFHVNASQVNLFHVTAALHFQFFVNCYNFRIAEWEPIVEPTRKPVGILYEHSPPQQQQQLQKDSLHIASEVIHLNLSNSMVETLVKTGQVWLKALEENTNAKSVVSVKFEPYSIINETGIRGNFWLDEEDQLQKRAMEKGIEHRFSFKHSNIFVPSYEQHSSLHAVEFDTKKQYIFIQLENQPAQKIMVTKVRKYYFKLKGSSNEVSMYCVNIRLVDGRKVVTIHSGVVLKNSSTETWQIGCYATTENVITNFGALQPKQSMYVPCQFVHRGILTVKPTSMSMQYQWSNRNDDFSFSQLMRQFGKRMVGCKNTSASHERAYCVLHSTSQSNVAMDFVVDCMIELIPPLAIENLLGSNFELVLFKKESHGGLMGVATDKLQCGEKRYYYNINLKSPIVLNGKLEGPWTSQDMSQIFSPDKASQIDVYFTNTDTNGKKLPLKIDYNVCGEAFHELTLFCSYWILNLTGKDLKVKVNEQEDAPGKFSGDQNLLLFDFYNPNYVFTDTIQLVCNHRFFSTKPVSIHHLGTMTSIEMSDDNRCFELGMDISNAPDKFQRTKVVTFTPRYILCNQTSHMVYVKQYEMTIIQQVAPEKLEYYYWQGKKKDPQLCIRMENTEWSTPFRINCIGEVPFILPILNKDDANSSSAIGAAYIMVQIHQEKGVIFVTVEQVNDPPFYLNNETGMDLYLSQMGTQNEKCLVAGSKQVPYSWPFVSSKHVLVVQNEKFGLMKQQVDVTIVANETKLELKNNPLSVILVRVSAQGMTRVVTFEQIHINNSSNNSPRILSKQSHSSSAARSLLVANAAQRKYLFQLNVDIKGIGVSCVDDIPEEIVYVLFEGIHLSFSFIPEAQYLELKLKKVQVNNQLSQGVLFPVVFTNSKPLDQGKHFLHVSIIRSSLEESYDNFPYFSILMQEADLCLDIYFVNRLASFIQSLVVNGLNTGTVKKQLDDEYWIKEMVKVVHQPVFQRKENRRQVYFKLLQLHPIKLNFSFVFHHVNQPITTSSTKKIQTDNLLFSFLNSLGSRLNANIDQVPIRFNALILEHPFLSRASLLESIAKHYTQLGISEMYKLLGSFDFIGNPIGLFNDIDSGVHDLFYEPIEGIIKSPEEFTKGLYKGSMSFLKHSIHGTFNFASKVTESIGNGLSYLTFDQDFIVAKQQSRIQERPKHIGEGIVSGFKALGSGLFEGASDLVTKPIEGASKGGIGGFFSGIGKGVLGTPIKPLYGLVDAVARTADGIRNTTTFFDKEEKVPSRSPRVFGLDGKLVPYDSHAAFGQQLLVRTYKQFFKKLDSTPKYIFHVYIREMASILMVSTYHLLCIEINSQNFEKVRWFHKLSDIESITKTDPTEIIIHLSQQYQQKESGWLPFSTVLKERKIISKTEVNQLEFFFKKFHTILQAIQEDYTNYINVETDTS